MMPLEMIAEWREASRGGATDQVSRNESMVALINAIEAKLKNADARHFNPPGRLPPVGCRLLIQHPEFGVIEVERPQFVTSLSDNLVYDTTMGVRITGRFPWTYP